MDRRDIMLVLVEIIHRQCMERWQRGGEYRKGATLKEHCINYSKPNPLVYQFMISSAESLGASAELVRVFYEAVLEANRMAWAGYTEAEAEQVYQDWLGTQN